MKKIKPSDYHLLYYYRLSGRDLVAVPFFPRDLNCRKSKGVSDDAN